MSDYEVMDPDINFSDHVPITVSCTVDFKCDNKKQLKNVPDDITQLRWDHGDIVSYYSYTRINLQPILADIDKLSADLSSSRCDEVEADIQLQVDIIYAKIIEVLRSAAALYIPNRKRSFYKFWWDESLNLLKQELINSVKIWKACGKPRSGNIFQKYQKDKYEYRKSYREHQISATSSYSNDLHDSLRNKDGKIFGKTWQSKFESKSKFELIDGSVDKAEI